MLGTHKKSPPGYSQRAYYTSNIEDKSDLFNLPHGDDTQTQQYHRQGFRNTNRTDGNGIQRCRGTRYSLVESIT
jgi:hypothetical protein